MASAEANPYAVVLAGLTALDGFKHGGKTKQATAFLREVGDPSRARLVIAERLRRGERLPGSDTAYTQTVTHAPWRCSPCSQRPIPRLQR